MYLVLSDYHFLVDESESMWVWQIVAVLMFIRWEVDLKASRALFDDSRLTSLKYDNAYDDDNS